MLSGFLVFHIFIWFFLVLRFPGVHRRLQYWYSLVCILVLSIVFLRSHGLHRCYLPVHVFSKSFVISSPTPPPSLFFLFFPIHLYPLIFIFCFSFGLVSVMSAIWIFSASSRDSRLLIFPFIPLTLIAAIVRFLFFLIFFLLFFCFWCVLVFLLLSSVFCFSWVPCRPSVSSFVGDWFISVFSWLI